MRNDRSSTTGTGPPAPSAVGRALHLLDLENLAGGSAASVVAIDIALDEYEHAVRFGAGDHRVVDCGKGLVLPVKGRWPGACGCCPKADLEPLIELADKYLSGWLPPEFGDGGRGGRTTSARTAVGPMFGHLDADLAQVEDLAGRAPGRRILHEGGAAPTAPLRRVIDDDIRVSCSLQAGAFGARLLALAALGAGPLGLGSLSCLALTFRGWVQRRQLARVPRVLAQLPFQLSYPLLQSAVSSRSAST